jgi:hypothetical protein
MQRALDFYIDGVYVAGKSPEQLVAEFEKQAPAMGFTPQQARTLGRWARPWHGLDE